MLFALCLPTLRAMRYALCSLRSASRLILSPSHPLTLFPSRPLPHALCALPFALCALPYAPCPLRPAPCLLPPTPYSLLPTPYSSRSALCPLLPTPYCLLLTLPAMRYALCALPPCSLSRVRIPLLWAQIWQTDTGLFVKESNFCL
jgi:hypothetical protein